MDGSSLVFLSFLHNILSSFHLSNTHTDIYMSVCSAQVHTYTVHTNSKCFQLCSILFCFRASLHLCSSCKRAKVRHSAFFCILLLFSFLIGFFLFLSLLPCLQLFLSLLFAFPFSHVNLNVLMNVLVSLKRQLYTIDLIMDCFKRNCSEKHIQKNEATMVMTTATTTVSKRTRERMEWEKN